VLLTLLIYQVRRAPDLRGLEVKLKSSAVRLRRSGQDLDDFTLQKALTDFV